MWEPTTSRLVEEGLARKVATGASVKENDGGFLAMRYDLIRTRPDVVKAWLNAELDAQLFLADPKNAAEIVKMAKDQTTGFSEKVLWKSMYGTSPESVGGTPDRNIMYYAIGPEAQELITRAAAFLFEIKSINTPKLRPEAVMPQFAQEILKERGLKSPLAIVKAQPDSASPK
jgi:NitT/TauT family transport system substrate-binding protein